MSLTRRTLIATTLAAAALPANAAETTAHEFSFPNIEGGTIRLADWAGKPVMVVNTASRCAYTYQYDALQALWEAYRDRGLVVLAVPSDDFGGQELATESEVKEFCEVNFGLDFPMTTITQVRGGDAHPFYSWAADAGGRDGTPRWNFHKILIGPDGRFLAGYPSSVEPGSEEIRARIETALSSGS